MFVTHLQSRPPIPHNLDNSVAYKSYLTHVQKQNTGDINLSILSHSQTSWTTSVRLKNKSSAWMGCCNPCIPYNILWQWISAGCVHKCFGQSHSVSETKEGEDKSDKCACNTNCSMRLATHFRWLFMTLQSPLHIRLEFIPTIMAGEILQQQYLHLNNPEYVIGV